MITKERLEELIEQGATIYTWNDMSAFDFNNNMKFEEKVFEIKLRKSDKILKFLQSYMLDSYDHPIGALYTGIPLNLLFETEWEMEFGNITRTETLKLPKWEDFKNFVNQYIKFYHNEYTYILESCFYEDGKETIEINCSYYDYGDNLLKLPLTKENYIEACKLCLRLFRGEEV